MADDKTLVWNPFKLVSNVPSPSSGEENRGSLYVNNHFHVVKEVHPPTEEGESPIIHLSIRRNDRAPAHDWRLFQKIKNDLAGEEWEAIELYPAESRLVDTSNQFHLWCFEEGVGIGWKERLVYGPGEAPEELREIATRMGGDPDKTFQRPFGQEYRVVGQDVCTACESKYNARTGCNCPPVTVVFE